LDFARVFGVRIFTCARLGLWYFRRDFLGIFSRDGMVKDKYQLALVFLFIDFSMASTPFRQPFIS